MSTLDQGMDAETPGAPSYSESQARAILHRPSSSPLLTLFALAAGAAVMLLIQRVVPESERSLMMCGALGAIVAVNAADNWITRRRLDAAITLLKLRDRSLQ